MIKAVVFDFFGVVITDGLELFIQELEKTKPGARRHLFDIIRQRNAGLMDRAESNRLITEYLDPTDREWQKKINAGEVKNPELLAWIGELHKNYKTALLSNAAKDSLHRRFEPGVLEALFDEIVVSAHEGMVKPDAEIYQLTAERLGVAPAECIFYDDRQNQVDGASATGMHAFLFTTVDQAKADFDKVLADPKS